MLCNNKMICRLKLKFKRAVCCVWQKYIAIATMLYGGIDRVLIAAVCYMHKIE